MFFEDDTKPMEDGGMSNDGMDGGAGEEKEKDADGGEEVAAADETM